MKVLKTPLKECRTEKKINQEKLAQIVGASRETIGRLETGRYQNPTLRLAYDVADYFGKTIEEIFYYEETSS